MRQANKWDFRFLHLAEHISAWSKDPSTKIGAVIADDDNIVIGMGYNGFPRGVNDSPERLNVRETKYKYVVHGEINACINAVGKVAPNKRCRLYVVPTLMIPNICPNCAKEVAQFKRVLNIVEVVGWYTDKTNERWQADAEISSNILLEAGINVTLIKPSEVIALT